MIIGNNNNQNNFTNQNFNIRMNAIKENKEKLTTNNYQPINTMQHSNILSTNDMHERSFQMLQDRLNKGLISVDEFNKKCKELSKR